MVRTGARVDPRFAVFHAGDSTAIGLTAAAQEQILWWVVLRIVGRLL